MNLQRATELCTFKGWLLCYVNYSLIFFKTGISLPHQTQGSQSLIPVITADETIFEEYKGLIPCGVANQSCINLRSYQTVLKLKKKRKKENTCEWKWSRREVEETFKEFLEGLQKCFFQREAENSNLWEPRRLNCPSIKPTRMLQNIIHAGTDIAMIREREQSSLKFVQWCSCIISTQVSLLYFSYKV